MWIVGRVGEPWWKLPFSSENIGDIMVEIFKNILWAEFFIVSQFCLAMFVMTVLDKMRE